MIRVVRGRFAATTQRTTRRAAALLVAATILGGASAEATSITTYNSLAAFNSAVGLTSLIGFGNFSGVTFLGTTTTLGNVTFTNPAARLFALPPAQYSTNGNPTEYLNVNALSSVLTLSFAFPVYSFAADWGYIALNVPLDGSTTMSLSTGDALSFSSPRVDSGTTPFQFFGFTSDQGIGSLTITMNEALALDNVRYTTTPAAPPVPEPASIALIGTGLAGLAVRRRRRRA